MNKKQLWLNLRDYNFNHVVPPHLWEKVIEKFGGHHSPAKAFANKISRKLGWNREFAHYAINEYKKFVYLGVVSDFVVTPSKIIDQVWHEHILFSKAYRQFCSEVIQNDFDHNPELLPADEQTEVFNAQYLDTLKLYKTEFGVDPPVAFWGSTKFEAGEVTPNATASKKKKYSGGNVDSDPNFNNDSPLHTYFDNSDSDGGSTGSHFNGLEGGDAGGAGAGSGWIDGTDSGHASDSSDSGSDGGSDGGSSGCSSGCSGGCGGGD